jgi:hypothetical protein
MPVDEAQQLGEGWRDFLERLEHFATTGECARYDWRRDFDGSVELPGAPGVSDQLFAPGRVTTWLSLDESVLRDGSRLSLRDGEEPATVTLSMVVLEPPSRVTFEVRGDGWPHTTKAQVVLRHRRDGTERCSRFWIDALRGAYESMMLRETM